ncbi:MAG: iron-siderophore ABC transporter substrate-binding protein [Actinomycetota bacterium]
MHHPVVPRSVVRLLGVFLALALVAAACGDSDDSSSESTTPATADSTTTTAEAAPETTEAPATTEAEEPMDDADAAACETGLRSFDHPFMTNGPLCIPETPERVVDLSTDALEVLVATGDAPVGTQSWATGIMGTNFPYLAPALDGIADLGFNPVNLEAVALAEPDLIISGEFMRGDIGDELVAIAPTVFFQSGGSGQWKEGMEFSGELLNRQDVVAERFAEYEARVADLQEALGDPSAIEVSVVRVLTDPGEVMMNMVASYPSAVLADVGLGRPESQALSSEEAIEIYEGDIGAFISIEQIELIDADHIFFWSQTPDAEQDAQADAAFDEIVDSPLFGTLEAIQNDNFTRVDGHWVGWGFHAAHAILDDLFINLAGVDPAEVSPNPLNPGS